MKETMEYRDSLPATDEAKQWIDIQFTKVCDDPIGVVRDIYKHFGMSYTKAFEARMQKYLDEESRNGGGSSKHSYTPEQYGLSKEMIDKQFHDYQERYLKNTDELRQTHPSGHATE